MPPLIESRTVSVGETFQSDRNELVALCGPTLALPAFEAKRRTMTVAFVIQKGGVSKTTLALHRHRLDLASGRYAMIDDGLGFGLLLWTSSLEQQLGREVVGNCAHGSGRMDIREIAQSRDWLSVLL